jgi:hypothetical protein
VIGIFPTLAAMLRLVRVLPADQHHEWQVSRISPLTGH